MSDAETDAHREGSSDFTTCGTFRPCKYEVKYQLLQKALEEIILECRGWQLVQDTNARMRNIYFKAKQALEVE